MGDIFLRLFNQSITAGYLIIAVLLLRLLFCRAPRWFRDILWGMAGLRLVLPFSIKSVFSLIPCAEILSPETVNHSAVPAVTSGIEAVDRLINPVFGAAFAAEPGQSINPLQVVTELVGLLWGLGFALMLLFALISALRIRARVRGGVPLEKGVFSCDAVNSPLIFGIIRPKIYLPSDLFPEDAAHILVHERAHIRRRDPLRKFIGFVLLSVYWFDPLVWVCYILFCRDMEFSCDEKAIRSLQKEEIAAYPAALLRLSAAKRSVLFCPVTVGEVGTRRRARLLSSRRAPGLWLVIAALLVCAATALCLLTDPKTETPDNAVSDTAAGYFPQAHLSHDF